MRPPGFSTAEAEFFFENEEEVLINNSTVLSLNEVPDSLNRLIDSSMNEKHHKGLDMLEIEGEKARRLKFIRCNLSAFDFTPDVSDSSVNLEYVECPERGRCRAEGVLCQPLMINGVRLTMAELRVISLIRKGLYDKEICSQLNIATQTLRTQKQSITKKLKTDRKVGIALFAVQHGIN